ncbi:MAG: DUF2326 domain-containing protein [Muribaculaceae bacterium]
MFIESLSISTPSKVIREINFHKGLNLIVDQTPENATGTGNNVGKTTVLRLIDFCLGKDADSIYKDPENKRGIYHIVKNFLQEKKVIITLVLVDDLDKPNKKIEINRNFLLRKDSICEIDGIGIQKNEFETVLMQNIFPDITVDKPTFRQIISHNIRYDDLSLTNTLRTLNAYTKDEEYETLYLFLFGCEYDNGNRRQELLTSIQNETKFKNRLEKQETKSAYKSALDIIDADIDKLNSQKSALNINPELDKDLFLLNEIKNKLNHISADITALSIRKDIILDTQTDFSSQKFNDDTAQLKLIYQQASALIPNLQKSFDELVLYHNQMLENKIKFISQELPDLNKRIDAKNKELKSLIIKEKELSEKVVCSDTFEDLELIISKLNALYQKKGEYESIISQINEVDETLKAKNEELNGIDEGLFSDDFKKKIDIQLSKFNKIFASISEQLYDEKYAIKCDVINKRGQNIYKFTPIDTNFSSGKKQGEISCFDIAYTKFADEEHIPCLHFILNDKKELVHDNQLLKIAEITCKENIQFVASILEDKLPPSLQNEDYYVVKLSQDDKLFRIESF